MRAGVSGLWGTASRSPRWAERVALALVAVFAFSATYKVSWANSALGLLLIAAVVMRDGLLRYLVHTLAGRITLAYLGYIGIYAAVSATLSGTLAPFAATAPYVQGGLLSILVLAFWFERLPSAAAWTIALLPLGLLARVLARWQAEDGWALLAGSARASFGDSAVNFALWALIGALCAILAAYRVSQQPSWSRPVRLGAGGALLVLAAVTLAGVFLSQTRAVWLLAIVLLPVLVVALLRAGTANRCRWPALVVAILGLASVLIGATLVLGEGMLERWRGEHDALVSALVGEWQDVDTETSVGQRLHIYQVGIEAVSERPWLGQGPGTDAAVLAASGDAVVAHYGVEHLHNSALVMWVEYGMPGLAFFAAFFLVPAWYARRALRAGEREGYAVLSLVVLIAMFGASMSNHVLGGYRAPFVLALFAGLAVARGWRARY